MKILGAGIIFLMLILYETTQAELQNGFSFKTSICQGKNGGLLPIFGTCKRYYICNDGNAIVGSCDENYRFDPQTLRCEDAYKVDCIYESLSDDQENDLDDDGDEVDTSEQVDDSNSESDEDLKLQQPSPPTLKKTPSKKPSMQNSYSGIRDKPNNLATVQPVDICVGKKNGLALPKFDSCSEYYVCMSKKPQLRHCPQKQHFSSAKGICMKPIEAKCLSGEEQQEKGLEETKSKPAVTAGLCSEEKQDALVPHHDDCGKFLLCSNMMFLVMDCPVGLHFNTERKRCDYPRVAKCQITKSNQKQIKQKSNHKRKSRKL